MGGRIGSRWSILPADSGKRRALIKRLWGRDVVGWVVYVFATVLNEFFALVNEQQLAREGLVSLEKDGIKTDIYQKGLADLWVGQDGKRYGLPKDFDTVSIMARMFAW